MLPCVKTGWFSHDRSDGKGFLEPVGWVFMGRMIDTDNGFKQQLKVAEPPVSWQEWKHGEKPSNEELINGRSCVLVIRRALITGLEEDCKTNEGIHI